jgi:hypothetical protein
MELGKEMVKKASQSLLIQEGMLSQEESPQW